MIFQKVLSIKVTRFFVQFLQKYQGFIRIYQLSGFQYNVLQNYFNFEIELNRITNIKKKYGTETCVNTDRT